MPKKILLVNKFFYPRGGDCFVTMSLRRLLMSQGMDVRVYAMDYPANEPLPEAEGFASMVDFGGGVRDRLRAASRLLGGAGIRASFRKALTDFGPDVVWVHNIHSYLSPAILEEAHRAGIRTLWTLHDYKLVCPDYICMDATGKVCTDCIGSSPLGVLRRRCMRGSVAASLLAAVEAMKWNRARLEKVTDLFVCPSRFMADMMVKGGFDPKRLKVVPNFLDPDKMELLSGDNNTPRPDRMVYVGRLSREKGVETLLESLTDDMPQLDIYGGGPLEADLRDRYARDGHVRFMGHADAATVASALRSARLSVVPSQWYENNPLSIIESLSAGTPVVGADMGGIPELLANPGDGMVFAPGTLRDTLHKALATEWDHNAIARRARATYSREAALERILPLLD